jgi:hypothetical protein
VILRRPWLSGMVQSRPSQFTSSSDGMSHVVEIAVRPGFDVDSADEILWSLGQVPWSELNHAYGPAIEVPVLIYAVLVGADETRHEAWWELWGNVHHQGTVYEATVPTVPFIGLLARAEGHPDRIEALGFLREVALGNGSFAAAVRRAVRPFAVSLAANWERETGLVQRAILWLISAFPDLPPQSPDLCRLIPEPMRASWDEVLKAMTDRVSGIEEKLDEDSDASMDRRAALEAWALAGWPSTV